MFDDTLPPEDRDPRPVRRSRGVGAAMMLGLGRALQQIYDEPPPEDGLIVIEIGDGEPDRSGPFWLEFDPDDPRRTVVHLIDEATSAS